MMCKHTQVRVLKRDRLSSVGNLCTKRCNILKRVIEMAYAWFLCITESVQYLRKWDLVFSTYKGCREFYTFIIIVFLGERKKNPHYTFSLPLSGIQINGIHTCYVSRIIAAVALLTEFYWNRNYCAQNISTEFEIRSTDKDKNLCIFFFSWKKLLFCQQPF